MDILYIIGKNTSQCDYFELRLSLRSIEKYASGVGRIFIAGYCPSWLSDDVIKIPYEQPIKHPSSFTEKHINMLCTVLYATANSDIDDEFLISMDDHIFINNVDFDNYPFYCKSFGKNNELPKLNTKICDSTYRKFLGKTRNFCEINKISPYYLCPHRNMHMSRKIINECKSIFNQIIQHKIPCESFAFMLNWRYTHYRDFEITPIVDVKILNEEQWWKADPTKTNIISTADFTKESPLYTLLFDRFPKKSKYEKFDIGEEEKQLKKDIVEKKIKKVPYINKIILEKK